MHAAADLCFNVYLSSNEIYKCFVVEIQFWSILGDFLLRGWFGKYIERKICYDALDIHDLSIECWISMNALFIENIIV